MDILNLNAQIAPPDEAARSAAQDRWRHVAKPVGSLGALEDDITRIAALTGDAKVRLTPRSVLVMCADNGVAAPDIAITPVRITRVVAEMMATGRSNVCRMARLAGARVFPFDVGMASRSGEPGLYDFHVADGTADITRGPAMTRDTAISLIEFGMEQVRLQRDMGTRLIATGEMGVGNTTTSSAMTAALLGADPALVTGRGSGLSDESLQKKISVVRRALDVNKPDPKDPLDVLSKVGGFDIAAMCGVFLGGAVYRVPVLLDGVISAVAALTAVRLCPAASCAMIATHISAEPAGKMLLDEMGLSPLICAGMRLGDGTGAVAAMPMLDMALEIYDHMLTFSDIGME